MRGHAGAGARQTSHVRPGPTSELQVQRKCACGQHTVDGGECAECRRKRLGLQRWATERTVPATLRGRGAASAAAAEQTGTGLDLIGRVRTRTHVPASAPEGGSEPVAKPSAAVGRGTVPPDGVAGATILAEDDSTDLVPGQQRKSDFLESLRTAVCAEADAALAGTDRNTEGRPQLASWFAYSRGRSAFQVDAALHRYAPESHGARSAAEFVPLVVGRVRQGVERWAHSGEIAGVPVSATMPPVMAPAPAVQLQPQEGRRRRRDDPTSVRAALGPGRSLDGPVRRRMESALGRSFAGVRLHTDSTAQRVADEQQARALTVGTHVAFGAGEYRPGTPVGDALLAHELAHVAQQDAAAAAVPPSSSSGSGYDALERDADRTALAAASVLWSESAGALSSLATSARPRLTSGLRLQRCDNGQSTAQQQAPPQPAQQPQAPAARLTLQKTTVSGPTARDCGGFSWGVQWSIANADNKTEGWVVQKVDSVFDVKRCDASQVADIKGHTEGRIDPTWYPYWEAWQVRKGQVFVGASKTPHSADTYASGGFGDRTKGQRKVLGDAEFYHNLALPNSFKVRPDHPARALPVAVAPPALAGGTGNLKHNLTADWNCCPGSESKATTITTE